jgi:DivIVA domain-containing protein
VFWIQLVVVTGVIFTIAAVVLGAGGSLPDAYREQPELRMPEDHPLTSADVDHIRFPVVFRGYRMSEVDDVLDRLTSELAARDARILELEYKLAGTTPPGIAVATPVAALAGATAAGASRTAPPPRGAGSTLSLEKPGPAPVEPAAAVAPVEPVTRPVMAVDTEAEPTTDSADSATPARGSADAAVESARDTGPESTDEATPEPKDDVRPDAKDDARPDPKDGAKTDPAPAAKDRPTNDSTS